MRLDHVQLAIPPDSEDRCRAFYSGVLGWREVPKPAALAGRGGLWLDTDGAQVHLGVEQDFRAARKAHPGFAVGDLDGLVARLKAAGCAVDWDAALPGVRRFYTADPFGNRIEFLEG